MTSSHIPLPYGVVTNPEIGRFLFDLPWFTAYCIYIQLSIDGVTYAHFPNWYVITAAYTKDGALVIDNPCLQEKQGGLGVFPIHPQDTPEPINPGHTNNNNNNITNNNSNNTSNTNISGNNTSNTNNNGNNTSNTSTTIPNNILPTIPLPQSTPHTYTIQRPAGVATTHQTQPIFPQSTGNTHTQPQHGSNMYQQQMLYSNTNTNNTNNNNNNNQVPQPNMMPGYHIVYHIVQNSPLAQIMQYRILCHNGVHTPIIKTGYHAGAFKGNQCEQLDKIEKLWVPLLSYSL